MIKNNSKIAKNQNDIRKINQSEDLVNSKIPEWQKKILAERLRKIEDENMEFVSWEKVKEMIQERMINK